jgi:predicted outer membrane lipoprotein
MVKHRMSFDASPGNLTNLGSGLLLLALAVWVATLRPRRRLNLALAAFCASMGVSFVVQNLVTTDDPLWYASNIAGWVAAVPAMLALQVVAAWFPRPLQRAHRGLIARAALLGLLTAALALGVFWGRLDAVHAYVARTTPLALVGVVQLAVSQFLPLSLLLQASFAAALVLLALRWPQEDAPRRRQVALVSGALLLYPGLVAGIYAADPVQGLGPPGLVLVAAFGVVAALWLRNTRAPGTGARDARHVALLALGMPLLGMVVHLVSGSIPEATRAGPTGLCRTLTVLLLAYGILRHQLLGIDVGVKWTIRRGTLAGVFIAVFFIVTQVAQNYLQYGVLVGAVAAGLLLFGLTPLQRFAERVADTALPGTRPLGELDLDREERATLYRAQARFMWSDGALSDDERRALSHLRDQLGLSRDEASRLEEQALAERARPA